MSVLIFLGVAVMTYYLMSILQAVHAHPTLSEAMGEAALAAHGRAIHF